MTPRPHVTSPPVTTRLRLDEQTPHRGDVDGAWWPRTRDLPRELPGLLERLADRVGPGALVAYHLDDWEAAPARIDVGGGVTRLEGFAGLPGVPRTVAVIAVDGQCVTLTLVAPDAEEEAARALLSVTPAGTTAASRALDEVATRLTTRCELRNEPTSDIGNWVREAAAQFTSAPIQTYVPVLVENLVRGRLTADRARPAP